MEIKRYLDLSLPTGQSAFLWGPRKAGKSTYLRQKFPHSPYYDLLDSSIFLRFLEAPYTLREELALLTAEQRKIPVIIDEIQKIGWKLELPGTKNGLGTEAPRYPKQEFVYPNCHLV